MDEQKTVVHSGFFDSVADDRLYSAEEMNRPYKRVISNGVFATPQGTPSTDLQVLGGNGLEVVVRKGEALFAGKWFDNETDLSFTITKNNTIVPRIDSIIAQVDKSQNGRESSIILREGTPGSDPQPPAINTEADKTEYRIANIYVPASATNIGQDQIIDLRGSAECPWVTSLIKQVDTSELFKQWQAAYQKFYQESTKDMNEYTQFQKESFNRFMKDLTEDLSVNTNLVKYESSYTTTGDSEAQIPINITSYDHLNDILLVRVNRLFATENVDYSINDSNTITLAKPISSGQRIDFVVLQSIVMGNVHTAMQSLQELNERISDIVTTLRKGLPTTLDGEAKLSITDANKNVLEEFVSLGVGYHTIAWQNGVKDVPTAGNFWAFGQVYNEKSGYIFAISADGSIYTNRLSASVWMGWESLFEIKPQALYHSAGGVFPNNDTEITPKKNIKQCTHGWQLVFSRYNTTDSEPLDEHIQTFDIPKRSHKNAEWSGEQIAIPLCYGYTDAGEALMCVKEFQVYNDHLTSSSINSQEASRNMMLRAVYEY